MKALFGLVILVLALGIIGCGKSNSGSVTPPEATAAPAPSNLTPEQKAAYDEAIKNAGPPDGK